MSAAGFADVPLRTCTEWPRRFSSSSRSKSMYGLSRRSSSPRRLWNRSNSCVMTAIRAMRPRLVSQASSTIHYNARTRLGLCMTDHWNAIRRHWELLGPPLRPPPQVVEAYDRELDLARSHVVMLGVTPELAGLGAA